MPTQAAISTIQEVLTVPEVAALLRVTPRHIQNMVAKRVLRPVRLGRRVLFLRPSVMRALTELEAAG